MDKHGLCPALVGLFFIGCTIPSGLTNLVGDPPPSPATRNLTLSWAIGKTGAKTIMPASFPSPATFDISLHPDVGQDLVQTGVTGTNWTFTNITAQSYVATIVGKDGDGNVLCRGTGTADLTTTTSLSLPIDLQYISSGAVAGQIHLDLDLNSAGALGTTLASIMMVDPQGTLSTITPTGDVSHYFYSNILAMAGIYQLFITISSSTTGKSAMKSETLTVFQSIDTAATILYYPSDFTATYVPVTSLALNKTSESSLFSGQTDALTTSFNSAASNTLVIWSSSDTSVAAVDAGGTVSILRGGLATITATSVDMPTTSAQCSYTVSEVTIVLFPTSLRLIVGGATGTITPTVGKAIDTSVTWATSDADIATVAGGVVAAVSVGNATITATSVADPSKLATCLITCSLFKVTYHANGASSGLVPLDSTEYHPGDVVTVKSNADTLEKPGFHFSGWNSTLDGNGTSYIAGSSTFTINADTDLYAWWQTAQWARSVSLGPSSSYFAGTAVDALGNIYAVGMQSGNGTFTYGTDVSAIGTSSDSNSILVKYNSLGTPEWVRTVTAGIVHSQFQDIAIDSLGNIYVVGYQNGTSEVTYGTGVSAIGTIVGVNAVLVKYDSTGTAVWARSQIIGTGSAFNALAVDSGGNIYVAGYQYGNSEQSYGDAISATGTSAWANALLVKYDSAGAALWAKTVMEGSSESRFNDVAVDTSGNVYVAGTQDGTVEMTYGTGISATGAYLSGRNAVIVKYDSAGSAIWVRSPSGSSNSYFNCLAVDPAGDVYTAGWQQGNNSFTYGTGVSSTGVSYGYENIVLVKYNSSGSAQWAKSGGAQNNSKYYSIATDSLGGIIVTGQSFYNSWCSVAAGVSIAGGTSTTFMAKYSSANGMVQWARSGDEQGSYVENYFGGVAVDPFGNVIAVGNQKGTTANYYGAGVSASGAFASGVSAIVVKYWP